MTEKYKVSKKAINKKRNCSHTKRKFAKEIVNNAIICKVRSTQKMHKYSKSKENIKWMQKFLKLEKWKFNNEITSKWRNNQKMKKQLLIEEIIIIRINRS